MKTIKYTVDRGFRKAGEVRQEEDGIADNLILRGFAEELDEATEDEIPDDEIGDGSAVDQYDPTGSEADPDSRGGAQSLPAELNAPGVSGSNVRSSRKTAKPSPTSDSEAGSDSSSPALTSEVSVEQRTEAGEAEKAGTPEGEQTTEGAQTTEPEKQDEQQSA